MNRPQQQNHNEEDNRSISLLSRLMFQNESSPSLAEVPDFSEQDFSGLVALADKHHVTVRALRVLEEIATAQSKARLHEWCGTALKNESRRIANAIEWLYAIVQALQNSACPVTVIKSLDHWPDLGSDLDLYTSGAPEHVIRVMREKLHAELEPRSWGDRLANKWNFQVPGLPELVEVHVRYLGQTGEQKLMAQRVLRRSISRTVNGRAFPVPAPEERILISTLQRMYRHFYFRLCDMADVAGLLAGGQIDFNELRRGAELGGIWPGVASFLHIVCEYVARYGGNTSLPSEVSRAAYSPELRVQFKDTFLRLPMGPAAGLFGSQLFNAGRHGDLRAISRLPLLPPLAVSALLAFRLTGSDKGIW
jgi:Uncharacterised nucleotidyltransferase